MKKFFLLFFTFLILSVSKTLASNFSLSFVTEYNFVENGVGTVKKTITLTNLTTSNYPSEYFIDLPLDATNFVSFDETGQTKTSIIDSENKKSAKIVFNKESLGYGKDITIAISYETKSLSSNENGAWQIAIPGFSSSDVVDRYVVHISFPDSWGTTNRIIPPPDTNLTWTLTERPETSISIRFEQKPTITEIPMSTKSYILPIVSGVSLGIVLLIVLFEILKRI